ncbi:hypothetical protein R0J90_23470, partial [Micrococcus sp. SIMBA_144]
QHSLHDPIESHPLLRSIPAVNAGALVLHTHEQEVLSVSAISPLSIPFALQKVVPPIAEAAKTAQACSPPVPSTAPAS